MFLLQRQDFVGRHVAKLLESRHTEPSLNLLANFLCLAQRDGGICKIASTPHGGGTKQAVRKGAEQLRCYRSCTERLPSDCNFCRIAAEGCNIVVNPL